MSRKLSEELRERGFINQFSGESLDAILDENVHTVYVGVDPTADSIHIGNLVVYMLMRHLTDAGHKPILLIGGGTGLIGDPKDTEERPLLDAKTAKKRTKKISKQVSKLLGKKVDVVNNADWLTKLNLIEFMRDIGKHFTVNSMIKREIVAKRLNNESPISYTEFAYAPLQAYDFWHLFKNHGCTLQIGGSDQWGNLMSGVDLIHKKEGAKAHALTVPLVVDTATGRKFGKSEGNAIWLDDEMTSPYTFYQFWLNVDDADVVERLKIFTLLSLEEIAELEQELQNNPSARTLQKALAYEVTKFVHGEDAAKSAKGVSEILFGSKDVSEISKEEIKILKAEAPTTEVATGTNIVDILISSELATSKGDARKLIEAGGVSINNNKVGALDYELSSSDFKNRVAILRKGKKYLRVLLN